MKFTTVLQALISGALGGMGFLFSMGVIFLIWGVFNGFNWDLQEFAMKMGSVIAVVVLVAYLIYMFVNRSDRKKLSQPRQKDEHETEWDKL